jgi:hypothetical protein
MAAATSAADNLAAADAGAGAGAPAGGFEATSGAGAGADSAPTCKSSGFAPAGRSAGAGTFGVDGSSFITANYTIYPAYAQEWFFGRSLRLYLGSFYH